MRMAEPLASSSGASAPQLISWPSLWRGGLLALSIVFVLSTQLLFQFGLYEIWSLPDILRGWLDHFVDQLIVGACIFACIALAVLVPAKSTVAKHVLLFAAILGGALAAEALLVGMVVFADAARWLVVAGLAYLLFVYQRQAAQAAAEIHENELRRIELDRQLTEAQLQSLRAQIEPHFLFNTLANVQQLYRTEPERGRRMLASFIAYLRATLPQMRQNETTLRQEVDLARAYLDVLQVRMGERLKVRFDVPQELAALPFPPLALSTLTENAVKHGLNPLPAGGAIEITARIEGRQLKVGVADTGAGLQQASGTGTGLANLRARLAALYGQAANLEIATNVPSGIRATIAVPARIPKPGEIK
jgi:sensor histidine kinase YesM